MIVTNDSFSVAQWAYFTPNQDASFVISGSIPGYSGARSLADVSSGSYLGLGVPASPQYTDRTYDWLIEPVGPINPNTQPVMPIPPAQVFVPPPRVFVPPRQPVMPGIGSGETTLLTQNAPTPMVRSVQIPPLPPATTLVPAAYSSSPSGITTAPVVAPPLPRAQNWADVSVLLPPPPPLPPATTPVPAAYSSSPSGITMPPPPTTSPSVPVAPAPSPDGLKFLGIDWMIWLIIVFVIGGGLWYMYG